ncbi:MAG: flotillin-like FloA family protein [Candidatus Riflebacteria bacterium]|nr:flotillin-like FloA family protein [Candidatus Riflebacteria bacterium]
MSSILGGIVVLVLVIMFFIMVSLFPFATYIKCLSAGVPATPIALIAMRLRTVPADLIVDTYIKGNKAGLDILLNDLEAHYLSGGDITRVIDAIISAERAKLNLSFKRAAAIDLAGRDVLEAVRMSVDPKVISTGKVSGVAKNGIEIIANIKVTVRANLETMVGGAGQETIIARVAQGAVSAIGSADTHTMILKQPDLITQKIMSMGLDSNTAFRILSIDIADVDVARNIGAILQNAQAEADKKVAKAKAEGRRAIAVAQFQENRAMEQEMRAGVVKSEIMIPISLAESYKAGKIFALRKKNDKAKSTFKGFGIASDNG